MSYNDSYSRYATSYGRSEGVVYYPPDMEGMIYLGTHQKSEPIKLQCGKCGYTGPSDLRKEKGMAWWMITVLTIGIAAAKAPKENHHYCPSCGIDCAYSKPL